MKPSLSVLVETFKMMLSLLIDYGLEAGSVKIYKQIITYFETKRYI